MIASDQETAAAANSALHAKWYELMLTNLHPYARLYGMTEGNLWCTGGCTEHMRQGSCSMHEQFVHKQRNLIYVAQLARLASQAPRILEIGVNTGAGSLALALGAGPLAELTLVDIGSHKYMQPCVSRLKLIVPNPITLHVGSSHKVLPSLVEQQAQYDLVHVDGGHEAEDARKDIAHAIALTSAGAIIVVDDTDCAWIQAVANEFEESGDLLRVAPLVPKPEFSTKDHAIYLRR
jgi:Methyltransferase domain